MKMASVGVESNESGQQRFEFVAEMDAANFLERLNAEQKALLERIRGAEPDDTREPYRSEDLLHWLSESPDSICLEEGLELLGCTLVESSRVRSIRCGEGHSLDVWTDWPVPEQDEIRLAPFITSTSNQFEAGTSFAERHAVEIRVRYTDVLDLVLTDRTETIFDNDGRPTPDCRFGQHLHLEEAPLGLPHWLVY